MTTNQTIVNLTPDTINLLGRIIPPSGMVARVSEVSVYAKDHAGVRLEYSWHGEIIDLPAPSPGTLYIVSAMVRLAVPERDDVASPGKLVRDDEGRVLGCASLVLNPPLGSVTVPYDPELYWTLDEICNYRVINDGFFLVARPPDIDKARELIARRDASPAVID